jgi:MFS family permease
MRGKTSEVIMDIRVTNKQLPYLFFYSFVILFVGMGLMPVLPLYAGSFGASSSITGLYLSVIYISITLSTILTGWLGLKLGRKRLYIISAAIGTPALALMGQTNALWQVVVLTAVVWFSGGICMALVNIFTGLYAGSENRGKWFSVISLGSPLGAIAGGLTVGGLIEISGYSLMFFVISLVWATGPLLAAVKLVDLSAPASRPPEQSDSPASTMRRERAPLLMLMGAILLSMTTVNVGRLVVPLLMDSLQYSAGDVTTANAIAGMVTLPFAYFLGTLSDRLGRKTVLSLGYLLAGGSVLILIVAGPLWHFWLATSLIMIALTVTGSVASAFATDLLSPQVLVRVLPWFTAVGFVAGVIGFSVAGVLIDSIGMTALLGFTTVLALLACALIWPLHCEKQIAALFEPAWTCDISMRATK